MFEEPAKAEPAKAEEKKEEKKDEKKEAADINRNKALELKIANDADPEVPPNPHA